MKIQNKNIFHLISPVIFGFALFSSTLCSAQDNRAIPPEKPKLIVTIVIEQMRYDFIDRFWNKFGDDGFKRISLEGSYFKDAQINYLFTQSSPGYATIVTGTNPSTHGIVADQWYNSISNANVKSTQNGKINTVGSNSNYGQHSPSQLVTSTVSDELKLVDSQSKVISLGLDPVSAVLSGGHLAHSAYWLDEQTGQWITSSFYQKSLPDWVKAFNDKKTALSYLDRQWTTFLDPSQYKESSPDSSVYEYGFGAKLNRFPYDLSAISNAKGGFPDYSVLNQIPFGNSYTKDFAIETIVKEEMGKDVHPDFLMLNFSATKGISNRFGPNAVETQDAYLRLDQELGFFLKFLDQEIGKHNVLVILTSNHGVAYSPAYLEERGIPSGQFKSYYAIALLKSYLNATYGKGEWIKLYYNQQIYLNKTLIEDSKIDLEEFRQKVVEFMIQYDGVANAVSASTVLESEFNNGLMSKMQNSFNQKRSGDVMINLKPGWLEDITQTTSSNSPYVYDTHVPLIFFGWRIKRQERTEPIDLIDIAPTLSQFLNIAKPNGCSGKPIENLLK